jgi:DNA invertase Pin-like site-specific DNA recombinase
MKTATAYYRVSTTTQDAENQAQGVRAYAATRAIDITEQIADTASGKTPWQDRPLADWLRTAPPGSTLLVAEISRLARSTLQVLEIAQLAVSRELVIIATKNSLTIDGSMSSKITTTILGLAAEIEREFISSRTREALASRRAQGLPMGRPRGSQRPSKLAKHHDQIVAYLQAKVPHAAIARILRCSRGTLSRYLNASPAQQSETADTQTAQLDFTLNPGE